MRTTIAVWVVIAMLTGAVVIGQAGHIVRFPDSRGVFATYSTAGQIDLQNEFFQDLGTNGRRCATCHRLENGMSFSTDTARMLFLSTEGQDPLFAAIDGTNRPDADLSTFEKRRDASSLLLSRGVIRIPATLPPTAEFTVDSVIDPNGYSTPANLNFYRRPLAATNLKFVGRTIMWDGREPNLASQANNAHISHAQSTQPLTAAQQQSIVDFESALFTAQANTFGVGTLISAGGGPETLSVEPFVPNANAPKPLPFGPLSNNVFTLYSDWSNSDDPHKQAVLRGQAIFNLRKFSNNPFASGGIATCATCHSSFNNGGNDHAGVNVANTGVAGGGLLAPPQSDQFLASDLPIYTLRHKVTGATVRVNDIGRAAVTGLWSDVGRFAVPVLRGVASHPPFFHNGMAKTLEDVVEFYATVIVDLGQAPPLTDQEKSDLVAFLETL
jgi:cytochrome c peroxidase